MNQYIRKNTLQNTVVINQFEDIKCHISHTFKQSVTNKFQENFNIWVENNFRFMLSCFSL